MEEDEGEDFVEGLGGWRQRARRIRIDPEGTIKERATLRAIDVYTRVQYIPVIGVLYRNMPKFK